MNQEGRDFQIETGLPLQEEFVSKKFENPESGERLPTVEEYNTRRESIADKIFKVVDRIQTLTKQIQDVREALGLNKETTETPPSVKDLEKREQELKQEQIEASANYPGNWALLLLQRMIDPITKEKFIKTRQEAIKDMKPGEAPQKEGTVNLEKGTSYQSHYQDQIDNYDQNVQKVFDSTGIGEASEYSKKKTNLGKGGIGQTGAVFSDAEKADGSPLTTREKSIIEAHEKGHGLRDFVSSDGRDFRESIDMDVVRQNDAETEKRETGYLGQPEEIAERMAQLKNYFGFVAKEVFTKEHLDFAKERYLQDVKVDNNMKLFLSAVTKETVRKFLETINKYPL